MRYLIHTLAIIMLACCCHAQGKGKDKPDVFTNKPPAEIKAKERKLDHSENKLTIKERDKGSKKESDYKPVKEYPLMFKNNRKARKDKK